MSDDDPRLTELDIECITITRDQAGETTIDGGGMSMEAVIFLLRSAEFLMMTDYFFADDDDED